MCGRVIVDYDEIMDVADGRELAEWISGHDAPGAATWNLKPTEQIPLAATSRRSGEKLWTTAHWGLVPSWSRAFKTKFPMFNARAETVATTRSFAPSLASARCVITASGFYEWTGPAGARTPHAIFGPQPILPMAGLYSWWRDPDAGKEGDPWRLTATVLTRASAGHMAELHERMPVFLDAARINDWLDPERHGDQDLVDAVSASSVGVSTQLRSFAVRPLRGDGPELISPA